MDVADGYYSSDPRVIYDALRRQILGDRHRGSRRLLVAGQLPRWRPGADRRLRLVESAPVRWLDRVWTSDGDLPASSATATEFGDQPGLGISTNTLTVTWDDYTCNNMFQGSEIDVLQKSDFETDTGSNSLYYFYNGPFAPQPVQGLGPMTLTYIVSNLSDCGGNGCLNGTTPVALVQAFTGTPEGGGVTNQPFVYVPMTPTAVNDTTGYLPPADQAGTAIQLQTNDDRFLNAVYKNGEIWTADGTSCQPSGDTVQRDCLDYVEIAAGGDSTSPPATLTTQIDNVGISGDDLYYPAVSLDQIRQHDHGVRRVVDDHRPERRGRVESPRETQRSARFRPCTPAPRITTGTTSSRAPAIPLRGAVGVTTLAQRRIPPIPTMSGSSPDRRTGTPPSGARRSTHAGTHGSTT